MVVLTIIADSNDLVIRFREPLGKSNYTRLLSWSLHNSWYNLKRREKLSIFDRQNNVSDETIPLGKYPLESLAKALWKILSEGKGFEVTMNDSKAAMVILKPSKKKVKLDRDLSPLLGTDDSLQEKNLISRFTSFNTYLVHCDFLNKDETYSMGNP